MWGSCPVPSPRMRASSLGLARIVIELSTCPGIKSRVFPQPARGRRCLERGRHVEPAKLLPEGDDFSDDDDQRWPEVEGCRRVDEVAERAGRRFLRLRCAPADQ